MARNTLVTLMRENREEILNEWFHQFIGAYPPETVKYFERIENTFTNPTSHRGLISNICKEL